MFHRERVVEALEAKADRFTGYEVALSDALAAYEQALAELEGLTKAEVEERLSGIPWPGARPTDEQDWYPGIVVPFDYDWTNHEQARAWAREVLSGVPTVAVDGSQILPSRDLSVPVGAVQIGWFVNPHDGDQGYVKDIHFEVLAPDELSNRDEEGFGFLDWPVNARRFVLECETLAEIMEDARDVPVKPVCFFDGSLIISFIQQADRRQQEIYLGAVTKVLDASEKHRVPLVGYVDTSYAKDLMVMLDCLTARQSRQQISDGAVLRPRMQWGDRTVAYVCARDDKVPPLGGNKYYDRILFVYLKTTADRPPARLDLPHWLLEAGELERTLDVVRAECVVGNGYPYAVETADAVTVITMQDRERFYRLFQEFAEKEGLPLRFSQKALSKRGRR